MIARQQNRFNTLLPTLAAVGLAASAHAQVVWSDDFGDVVGAQQQYTLLGGSGAAGNFGGTFTRPWALFAGGPNDASFSFYEDPTPGSGFGSAPGVASWVLETSWTAGFFGLQYRGKFDASGNEVPVAITPWTVGSVTNADLARVKISFRYKCVNSGFAMQFRIEPSGAGFGERLELGQFGQGDAGFAVGEWQLFSRTLDQGSNAADFLARINGSSGPGTKNINLIWGDLGGWTYFPFANLFIDDIKVEVLPPACYANCDGSTTAPVLGPADFSCFLGKFRAGDSYANCDGSTTAPVLGPADFSCFLGKFRAGCQ